MFSGIKCYINQVMSDKKKTHKPGNISAAERNMRKTHSVNIAFKISHFSYITGEQNKQIQLLNITMKLPQFNTYNKMIFWIAGVLKLIFKYANKSLSN